MILGHFFVMTLILVKPRNGKKVPDQVNRLKTIKRAMYG